MSDTTTGFVQLSEDETQTSTFPTDWELTKRLFKIAAPVYPSWVVGMCLGLFSSALVGQLGDRSALAAVGLSNVMTNILGYSWLWGLSGAISTLSAQDWGAGAYASIGITLQRGFLILACFADLPLMVLWLNSEFIMDSAGQPAEVAKYVGLYTRIRIPGILCETISTTLNRTLNSIGNTRISSVVSLVVSIVNVASSMILIPRYGFVGAPITATLCDIVNVVLTCFLALRTEDFLKCWNGLDARAWKEWSSFLKISLPSFVLLASEAWCWNLQDFIAGYISEVAMATQAVAPSITALQYITGAALSVGSSTVIGNLLGEGSGTAARRVAVLSMQLLQYALLPQAVLICMLKSRIPYLFTQDEEIISKIESLLPLTMVFSFLDTQQAVLTGIIGAAGKQAVAAPLIAICYWVVGIPLGIALAFGMVTGQSLGLYGLWLGMLVAVTCHSLSFLVVVLRIDWDIVAEEVKERNRHDQLHTPSLMNTPAATPMVPWAPPTLMRAVSGNSAMPLRRGEIVRSKSIDFIRFAHVPPTNELERAATS